MNEKFKPNSLETIPLMVSEIFPVFLDMPGGIWTLAILCDLLQEMIYTGNWQAAEMIISEIRQVAEVEFLGKPMDQPTIQMFCDMLTDCVIETEAAK